RYPRPRTTNSNSDNSTVRPPSEPLLFPKPGLAQSRAGLECFPPDRVVLDVLDGVAADMGFRRRRTVPGNAQHIERLKRAVGHEQMSADSKAGAMDDMPCCPGKPSLPDCDKDCPFTALCSGSSSKTTQSLGSRRRSPPTALRLMCLRKTARSRGASASTMAH